MFRPRLVSKKFYRKILHNKNKLENLELSENFSILLIIFLIGGIAVVYYKYNQKKNNQFMR